MLPANPTRGFAPCFAMRAHVNATRSSTTPTPPTWVTNTIRPKISDYDVVLDGYVDAESDE
jgi:hypothetical protein